MRYLIALAFVIALAPAAAAAPEDVANRLSNEIMSPFCPGVTLHDCPSKEADDLRAQIRDWSAAGWSEDQIITELTQEYGPGISATPPDDGGALGAWALPALVAAGGLLFAGALARRWTKARDEDREREELEARRRERELGPEQRERLAAELAAHELRMSGGSP